MCYKLSNMRYKLCNKKYLIGKEKYQGGRKKRKAESKKYLPGKDGCFKQKLAKTATISPAICK